MKTIAEYFGFRPTQFLPNGCGAGITREVVPDEVVGANFGECCDRHDLEYHVGKGGWRGLFTEKPRVDLALARCMKKRFDARALRLWNHRRDGAATVVMWLAIVVPLSYFIALTLLGWTPLTWPWRERPMPSHEDLVKVMANNKEK